MDATTEAVARLVFLDEAGGASIHWPRSVAKINVPYKRTIYRLPGGLGAEQEIACVGGGRGAGVPGDELRERGRQGERRRLRGRALWPRVSRARSRDRQGRDGGRRDGLDAGGRAHGQ